jgi:integrase
MIVDGRTNNASGAVELTRRVFSVARRDNPAEVSTFRYEDDKWHLLDLLRPHERNSAATINFSSIKEWLRDDAKEYLAHLWLETSTYANYVQQTMTAIRALGRMLPGFKGRPIDLRMRHAQAFIRLYKEQDMSPQNNKMIRDILNRFMRFVRSRHPEEKKNNFKVFFPKLMVQVDGKTPLGLSASSTLSIETQAAIIDACVAEVDAYHEAKKTYIDSVEDPRTFHRIYARRRGERQRQGLPTKVGQKPKLRELLSRAVKAQAVILGICVGRRISAVCNTKYNVRTKRVGWVNAAGHSEEGVLIRFREMKIRNIDEDVHCPEVYGELALQAIKTARELTVEMRRDNPEWAEYLFLVLAKKRKRAFVLSPKQINNYLNGEKRSAGLLERYQIPGGRITTHSFRRTRATSSYKGGLRAHEIGFDLGHTNTDMAARHYIAGKEKSREKLQSHMDSGMLRSALEGLVGVP